IIMEYGFQVADYVVCGLVIMTSIGIGLYHACSGGRQSTTLEYHLGNRNLQVIPVMLSLMVTSQSSILLIGVPAEVYIYGIMPLFGAVGFSLAYLLSSRIIIPLIHPMKITSVNEYFECRYKTRHVRFFMTFLGAFFWVLYLGIITYGLATAIESVIGVPVWISIIAVSGSSMIYVSLGGIKAVVWTDVFQYCIMMTAVLAVLIKGSIFAGGGTNVANVNIEARRLQSFEFRVDPTIRYTVWNAVIGGTFKLIAFPMTQSAVQRIGCMPTIKDAYRMYYLIAPFIFATFVLSGAQGFVAYAFFDKLRCDPIESRMIKNANQIIPHMVVRLFYHLPGLSGVFIAGLFCATMSTISSGYSALSAMTLEDFVKIRFKSITEFQATVVSKITVVIFSVITTAMAFLMANVKGTLLQLASVLLSIPMAPYTGIFLYSIFCSWATSLGAIIGGVVSLLFYIWLSMGQTFTQPPNLTVRLPPAPTDMCPAPLNGSFLYDPYINNASTTSVPDISIPYQPEGVEKFYAMSFQWFDMLVIAITILIASIASLIIGRPKQDDVDVRYMLSFTDQFLPFLPKKVKNWISFGSTIGERRAKLIDEEKRKREQQEILIEKSNSSSEQIKSINSAETEYESKTKISEDKV
ncbi:hypothetical protein FSP39_016152, partial [Pinctada imbricata]